MNQIFSLFIPKDKTFQPLFEQSAENLVKISESFITFIRSVEPAEKVKIAKEIKSLELTGDQATDTIYAELNKSFIVPFDKQDVHALATSIDDIADDILGTTLNMELYQLDTSNVAMLKLAEIIAKMCSQLCTAIKELKHFKNKQLIINVCVEVGQLESKADRLYEQAISLLFDKEIDAISLIRQSEILAQLEKTTDKCDDLANVIETIFLKNA
ncbi:DUF47 domain-containing protein [Pedobacter sp. Leaf194]|uniref:DUF47 domain-containing protein n=1 Tax=Pedobacter sp. Leaf194 TaxID=1736297 RepID=UPI0007032C39|nr:DUF47 family protein [Pedobacter sp. Leaf194]KQS35979.1 phosphate transport regulator [Pedobacter sp. Leaf194]RYD79222.1 MAG: DUF47 family protein [Sphingobacteriales bacterium]